MFDNKLLKNIKKLYQIYDKQDLKIFMDDLEKDLLSLPQKVFAQKTVEVNILFNWIKTKREIKLSQFYRSAPV